MSIFDDGINSHPRSNSRYGLYQCKSCNTLTAVGTFACTVCTKASCQATAAGCLPMLR